MNKVIIPVMSLFLFVDPLVFLRVFIGNDVISMLFFLTLGGGAIAYALFLAQGRYFKKQLGLFFF